MRVFAGPNGSGKSTIISSIRQANVNGHPLDFGIYVNADDIARALRNGDFNFAEYQVSATKQEVINVATDSGLLLPPFTREDFNACFELADGVVTLTNAAADERLAQILADFLRKKLVAAKKKFSFETVFSHPSKLEIMREAQSEGYKVYLYFVSTESPEINIFRVALRVKQDGHNVPEDKIRSRYYRSLDLLYEAAQITHQSFFFDNSTNVGANEQFVPFAQFKVLDGKKVWSDESLDGEAVPEWFIEYYYNKIPASGQQRNSAR